MEPNFRHQDYRILTPPPSPHQPQHPQTKSNPKSQQNPTKFCQKLPLTHGIIANLTKFMNAHIPYNPQATQAQQDASIHLPIKANNLKNRDLQPISKLANSRPTKPFFVDDGGTHDPRPPPQDTTHHGASSEHMSLPQFGIEMAVRPEQASNFAFKTHFQI
ncbi:Hypothetical predicted protein [Olea europaea subsp. europaea]|uniref:Uncharacterized protein n=1 Tax=Olea europaea subsp. europaea TaxID=158383 RepID=A0A8S0PLH6_OLEEU|nr:Hypothetical predicted protein [Olea europaea subsp. europaea]